MEKSSEIKEVWFGVRDMVKGRLRSNFKRIICSWIFVGLLLTLFSTTAYTQVIDEELSLNFSEASSSVTSSKINKASSSIYFVGDGSTSTLRTSRTWYENLSHQSHLFQVQVQDADGNSYPINLKGARHLFAPNGGWVCFSSPLYMGVWGQGHCGYNEGKTRFKLEYIFDDKMRALDPTKTYTGSFNLIAKGWHRDYTRTYRINLNINMQDAVTELSFAEGSSVLKSSPLQKESSSIYFVGDGDTSTLRTSRRWYVSRSHENHLFKAKVKDESGTEHEITFKGTRELYNSNGRLGYTAPLYTGVWGRGRYGYDSGSTVMKLEKLTNDLPVGKYTGDMWITARGWHRGYLKLFKVKLDFEVCPAAGCTTTEGDFEAYATATQQGQGNFEVLFNAKVYPEEDGQSLDDRTFTYYWDYGDGTRATTTTPQARHTYPGDGPYAVTLTAVDEQRRASDYSFTLSNISQEITDTVDFLLVGATGSAPHTVQVDTRQTLDENEYEEEERIWSYGDNSLEDDGAVAFHTYDSPGTYQVVLSALNSDGFTVKSSPQTVTVSGFRPQLKAGIKATAYGNVRTRNDQTLTIGNLPELIELSADESYSLDDSIVSYEWTTPHGTLYGKNIKYPVTRVGTSQVTLKTTDIHGNTDTSSFTLQSSFTNCYESDGESFCLKPVGDDIHPLLPFSQNSWSFDTELTKTLADAATQTTNINSLGISGWARLREQTTKEAIDVSTLATTSGSQVTIQKAGLTDLGIDLIKTYDLELTVIDTDGELHTGTLPGVHFGVGSLTIQAPNDRSVVVQVTNDQKQYSEQVALEAGGSQSLSNLPVGWFVARTMDDQAALSFQVIDGTGSHTFTISDLSSGDGAVSAQKAVSFAKTLSGLVKESSISKKGRRKRVSLKESGLKVLSPQEAAEHAREHFRKFDSMKQVTDPIGSLMKSTSFSSKVSVMSTVNSQEDNCKGYPLDFCYDLTNEGLVPDHFPLFSTLPEKKPFEKEGVKGWVSYFNFLRKELIPLELMKMGGGNQVELDIMCLVGGEYYTAPYLWYLNTRSSKAPEYCRQYYESYKDRCELYYGPKNGVEGDGYHIISLPEDNVYEGALVITSSGHWAAVWRDQAERVSEISKFFRQRSDCYTEWETNVARCIDHERTESRYFMQIREERAASYNEKGRPDIYFEIGEALGDRKIKNTELSQSFSQIARKKDLKNSNDYTNYFGITTNSDHPLSAEDIYLPFDINLKIPKDFESPTLEFVNEVNDRLCYVAVYDEYMAEVVSMNALKTPVMDLNTHDVENSTRSLARSHGGIGRFFPLADDHDNDKKPLPNLSSKFPFEVRLKNALGYEPEDFEIKVSNGVKTVTLVIDPQDEATSVSDGKFIRKAGEDAKADVQTYQMVIDTKDLSSEFSWSSDGLSIQEMTFLDVKARFRKDGQTRWSKSKSFLFNTLFNLRRDGGEICKNGFYSFPLAFARPSFMKELYNLANNILDPSTEKFRCNDVSHPFGGRFSVHRTHNNGNAIDLRYFDPDSAIQDMRDDDKGETKDIWVNNMFHYYKDIDEMYFSGLDPISEKHLLLKLLCERDDLETECQKIGSSPGSFYSLETIMETCMKIDLSDKILANDLGSYCGVLPRAAAYGLSEYIKYNRSALGKIKAVTGGNSVIHVGIGNNRGRSPTGWHGDLLRGGVSKRVPNVSDFYPLFVFDDEQNFNGTWQGVNIGDYKPVYGHDDHLHLKID